MLSNLPDKEANTQKCCITVQGWALLDLRFIIQYPTLNHESVFPISINPIMIKSREIFWFSFGFWLNLTLFEISGPWILLWLLGTWHLQFVLGVIGYFPVGSVPTFVGCLEKVPINAGLREKLDLNCAYNSIEWRYIRPRCGSVPCEALGKTKWRHALYLWAVYKLLEKTQHTVAQLHIIMQVSYHQGSDGQWRQ